MCCRLTRIGLFCKFIWLGFLSYGKLCNIVSCHFYSCVDWKQMHLSKFIYFECIACFCCSLSIMKVAHVKASKRGPAQNCCSLLFFSTQLSNSRKCRDMYQQTFLVTGFLWWWNISNNPSGSRYIYIYISGIWAQNGRIGLVSSNCIS